jgi:aminoglycoside phosphotransferase (APT) family kinase protein
MASRAANEKSREAQGYDIPVVEAWIEANTEGLTPPFEWTRLEGGHSNLTYLLQDVSGRKAVIRRPPLGELLPKAHDMSREWALISSLAPTGFPVPAALGFCDDKEVTGAFFYVMGFSEGRPLYTAAQTEDWVPVERRVTLSHSFIDTLADLHALDPDAVGLGTLGKKEDYVGRQVKTWYRSWLSSVEPAQYDDPRAHELRQYFLDHRPEQGRARVVHGDYGFHNCLIGSDSKVAAVVDWEISTLGDPLADLAYTLKSWPETDADIARNPNAPTSVGGFPFRGELAQRYADRTGRNIDLLDFYIGLNHWKGAAILHGVYARYLEGKKSTEGVDLGLLLTRIDASLAAAVAAIDRVKSAE